VSLALDCQQAVLERDLQVIGTEARQFRGYQVGVITLGNVDCGCPRLAGGPGSMLLAKLAGSPAARHPALPYELILRAAQVIE
jgi:hypothetical protein